MTGNKLKTIACISMLIDHIGYLLFPKLLIFRYIGRLAMPLFAFFIGEGCLYTRNKKRYFLQLFLLGIICQAAHITEQLIQGDFRRIFLNILLTFSLAVLLCFSILRLKEKRSFGNILFFGLILCGSIFICFYLKKLLPWRFSIDYGLFGILLPATVVIFSDKAKKATAFSVGLLIYCLFTYQTMSFVWFALCAVPLLFLYNGQRGNHKFKYAFYIFYPTHLAILYCIQYFFT